MDGNLEGVRGVEFPFVGVALWGGVLRQQPKFPSFWSGKGQRAESNWRPLKGDSRGKGPQIRVQACPAPQGPPNHCMCETDSRSNWPKLCPLSEWQGHRSSLTRIHSPPKQRQQQPL